VILAEAPGVAKGFQKISADLVQPFGQL